MIYQVGKKQCSNSGRKGNDIAPLESDFMVQPPSLLEFPGPLTPPPPWNFQFPPWWGSGYFLEPHIYVYVVVNFLSQVVFGFLLFLGMVMFANKVETKLPKRLKISYQEPCKKHIISIIVYFQNISIPTTKGMFAWYPPPPPEFPLYTVGGACHSPPPHPPGISVNFQPGWVPSGKYIFVKIIVALIMVRKR